MSHFLARPGVRQEQAGGPNLQNPCILRVPGSLCHRTSRIFRECSVSGHVMIYRTSFHVPSAAAEGSVNVPMKSLCNCRATIIKAKGTFVLLAWHLWGRSRAQGLSTEHELPESSMGWCCQPRAAEMAPEELGMAPGLRVLVSPVGPGVAPSPGSLC